MAANLKRFRLNDLNNVIDLPNGKAAMYVEACVWCMDQHGHQNGIELEVKYERKNYLYSITWLEERIDIPRLRKHYNDDDAVEFGSEALAFFICLNHTEYDRVQRSMKKTGIDYWLAHKNTDPNLPFHNSGRLEVSGILRENEKNTVEQRIKKKLKQVAQSDHTTLPVYIVVVCFDQPYAKMVVKDANS